MSAVVPIGDAQSPVTTGIQGTTSFVEASNVLEQTAPTIPRPISDPYPDTTPTLLLNRSYNVSSTTWTPGMAPLTLYLPGVLMNNPTIANVLKRYRFLRSDICLEIKLNSTPYHQGALIGAYLPCANGLPTMNASKYPFFLSGVKNHVIINASTQDSVKITIPWLAAHDWFDSWYMLPTNNSIIGTFHLVELNALVATSAGQAPAVPINVFASFPNPRVTGYTSDMNKQNKEASSRSSSGLDVKTAVSTVSKVLRKVPVVGDMYSTIADAVNMFAGDLSKPISQAATQPCEQRINDNLNQADGLISAKELTLYHNSQVHTAPVFETMETCHMSVSQMAQMPMLYAMSSLNPNNPTINIPVLVNTNYMSTGSYQQNPLGDWLVFVSRAHRFWRGSIKYMIHVNVPSFYSFRLRVTLRYKNAYVDLGDLQSHVYDIKGETFVKLSVPYLYSTMYRVTNQEGVGLTHPWLSLTMETPIIGSSSLGSPFAYVNIYRSGGEDTQFAQLIHVGQFTVPKEKEKEKEEKRSERTSDCSPFTEFSKPFDTLIPGVTQSIESRYSQTENTGTVMDCMKRPSLYTPQTGVGYAPFSWTTPSTAWPKQAGEPFHYFGSVFIFRRGSLIYGRSPAVNGAAVKRCSIFGYSNDDCLGDASFFSPNDDISLYTAMQNAVTLPWFCELPWMPTNTYGYNYTPTINSNGSSLIFPSWLVSSWPLDGHTYVSSADDTLFMYPLPLFPYYFGPSDFSRGFAPHP